MQWTTGSWWEGNWEWDKQFIIFPRKSDYSKKWLWMEHVMYGRKVITGPGTPAIFEKYMTPKELTLHLLKGTK